MAIHAVFAFVASAREPVQMDIMTGISALSQALNIAKQLKEFEREFKDAEFKLKIADLYSSLADAKIALADAKIELDAKEAEIERLKRTHRRLEEARDLPAAEKLSTLLYDLKAGRLQSI